MIFDRLRNILAVAMFATLNAMQVASAQAEPRLALVIGNSNYGGELGKLANPANDATLMEQALKQVGFDVAKLIDADQKSLKRAISDFGERLARMGSEATGLFFYAGHGLQVKGRNYLVPVSADIRKEADVDLESVSAETVLAQMEYAGSRVNIVILDACRNNPLTRSFRSADRGLARIDAPKGSFIAYSTAPGDVAADGTGTNSPYAAALAAAIRVPGKGIEEIFRDVRGEVLQKTAEAQTPWESSSLTAPFYFTEQKVANDGEGAVKTASAESSPDSGGTLRSTDQMTSVDPTAIEMTFWNSIKDSKDPADFEVYLIKYPQGDYAPIAKNRIENLKPATAAIDPSASIVAEQQLLYAKSEANIRGTPNKKGAVLGRLPADTELNVTGHTGDGTWYRVALEGGQIGYVHRSLVTDKPSQTASIASDSGEANSNSDEAAANNESFAAAPNLADAGTTTSGMPATSAQQSPSAGDQQMNAAISGFLGSLTGQSGFRLPPTQGVPVQGVASDPAALDGSIMAQLAAGDANGAARQASMAQTEDPGFWSKSAMMAFYANGRPDLAANMAKRAVQDNPGYLYGWIWMAMGLVADGNSSSAALIAEEGISNFGHTAWPVPIAEFLGGSRSIEALLAVAEKGNAESTQICQANYYAGAVAWHQGDRAAAQSLLQKAASGGGTCPESAGALALLLQ